MNLKSEKNKISKLSVLLLSCLLSLCTYSSQASANNLPSGKYYFKTKSGFSNKIRLEAGDSSHINLVISEPYHSFSGNIIPNNSKEFPYKLIFKESWLEIAMNPGNSDVVLSFNSKEYHFERAGFWDWVKLKWDDLGRGLLGIFIILGFAFLLSENNRNINWRLVASGLALQLILAIAILKVDFIRLGFDAVSAFFVKLLDFTMQGSIFLFGDLVKNVDSFGYIFAFQVLPTVIFFSALTSLLYYLGVLQKIVYGFAWLMKRTMQLSGAESLAAAANIFVGQTEAPLMVKPYIQNMSRSEIMALMTGGMATIAGGVLAAYIGFLGGTDPVAKQLFARHLLAASIISAPASLLIAKLLIPETEKIDHTLLLSKEVAGNNILDALSNGTSQGLKLAVNVGAMLLVFTAMIALANYLLENWIGSWTGLNDLIASLTDQRYQSFNLQFILGYIFAPFSWVMGVPGADLFVTGQLLGEKTILNEFYAYTTFGEMKTAGILKNEKSIIIATYALCGFANFASIGIQIGGIGSIAPNKRVLLSKLGIKALIAGTLACFMTACIAGMLI